ncbi:MAG: hypothetical protein K2Y39_01570 [Candidatus Obscuribacterales bacterium]|nr:hypothetical protein [Candidatus Obscuribacterales bacterium]
MSKKFVVLPIICIATIISSAQTSLSSELAKIDVTTLKAETAKKPAWVFATVEEGLHFDPWRNKKTVKTWTTSERKTVDGYMKRLQVKYGRLLKRAGSLTLVRITQKEPGYNPCAMTFAGAVFIPDRFFHEERETVRFGTILHEITHSADWGNLISNSAEWVKYSSKLKVGNPPQYPVDLNELLAWAMEFFEEKNKLYDSAEFAKQFLPKLLDGPQEYDDYNRLSMKSSLAFKQRKYMLSIKLAEEAEQLFPSTPKPHMTKSICFAMLGRATKGLNECTIALSCFDSAKVPHYSDDYLDALCIKASCLNGLERFDEAEKTIDFVVASPNKYAQRRAKSIKQRIQEARKQAKKQPIVSPGSSK